MKPEQIAAILSTRKKGQIYSILWRRSCKVKKGIDHKVEKQTHAQGILAEYGNFKPVKEGILNGERLPPEAPKGTKEVFYIENLKFFNMMSGKTCLAVPLSGNSPIVEFFVDGKPSPEPDYLLASEKVQPESKEELAAKHFVPYKLIDCESIVDVR